MLLRLALAVGVLAVLIHGDYKGRLCGSNWGENNGNRAVPECIKRCTEQGYQLAGLIYGHLCMCKNDTTSNDLVDPEPLNLCEPNDFSGDCGWDNCTANALPCEDDPDLICGGKTWFSLYDAGQKSNVIERWSTKIDQVCSGQEENCKWKCHVIEDIYSSEGMFTGKGGVVGTEGYGKESSFCLSAVHDGRYVPGSEAEITYKGKKPDKPPAVLQGGWRYGVVSNWNNSYDDYVYTIQDPPRGFVYPENSEIFAEVNLTNRELVCRQSDNSKTKIFATRLAKNPQKPQSDDVTYIITDGELVYCGQIATDGDKLAYPATYIPVVLEPAAGFADIYTPTQTVAEGSNARVDFKKPKSGSPFSIQKHGHDLTSSQGSENVTVMLHEISTADGGFYELHDSSDSVLAVTRVIVTAKPVDTCNRQGYQKEMDGTCVCAPPFTSTGGGCKLCTDMATYGPNCDLKCPLGDCKGHLFCGTDGFGCHCASGYYGAMCTDPCPAPKYGLDCAHDASGCHCKGADQKCDTTTGECANGCQPGWYGDSCDQEGPYLKEGPYSVDRSATSITVGWDAWSKTDGGIDISGAQAGDVQYMLQWCDKQASPCVDDDFHNISNSVTPSVAGQKKYTYKVDGLTADTDYAARTVIIYKNEDQKPSPQTTMSTICSLPPKPPQDVKIISGQNAITVKWEWPVGGTGCKGTEIICNATCSSCDGMVTDQPDPFITRDQKVTDFTFPVHPFTTCVAECYLHNDQGDGDRRGARGSPDAGPPGQVQNLMLYSTESNGVLAVWDPPRFEEGHVSKYEVTIRPSNANSVKSYMQALKQGSFGDPAPMPAYSNHLSYPQAVNGTTYQFSVQAITDYGRSASTEKSIHYLLNGASCPSTPSGCGCGCESGSGLNSRMITAIVVLAVILLVMLLLAIVLLVFAMRGRGSSSGDISGRGDIAEPLRGGQPGKYQQRPTQPDLPQQQQREQSVF